MGALISSKKEAPVSIFSLMPTKKRVLIAHLFVIGLNHINVKGTNLICMFIN